MKKLVSIPKKRAFRNLSHEEQCTKLQVPYPLFSASEPLMALLEKQSENVFAPLGREVNIISIQGQSMPYVPINQAYHDHLQEGAALLNLSSRIETSVPESRVYAQIIFYQENQSGSTAEAFIQLIQNNETRLIACLSEKEKNMRVRYEAKGEEGGTLSIKAAKLEKKLPHHRLDMVEMIMTRKVGDAQGANSSNEASWLVSCEIEKVINEAGIVGWKKGINILSNANNERICHLSATFSKAYLEEQLGRLPTQILLQSFTELQALQENFSTAVFYNAAIIEAANSLNKATQNDTRAFSSAVHYYAATQGQGYHSIFRVIQSEDTLSLTLSLPTSIGTVGAATQIPHCKGAWEILGNPSAAENGQQLAKAGLAGLLAAVLDSSQLKIPVAKHPRLDTRYLKPDMRHQAYFPEALVTYTPLSSIPEESWFFTTEEPSMIAGLNRVLKLLDGLPFEHIIERTNDPGGQTYRIQGTWTIPNQRFSEHIRVEVDTDTLLTRVVLAAQVAERSDLRPPTSNKGFMNTVIANLEAFGYPQAYLETVAYANAYKEGLTSFTQYKKTEAGLAVSADIILTTSAFDTPTQNPFSSKLRETQTSSPEEKLVSLTRIGTATNLAALLAIVNHEENGIIGAHNTRACKLAQAIDTYSKTIKKD